MLTTKVPYSNFTLKKDSREFYLNSELQLYQLWNESRRHAICWMGTLQILKLNLDPLSDVRILMALQSGIRNMR